LLPAIINKENHKLCYLTGKQLKLCAILRGFVGKIPTDASPYVLCPRRSSETPPSLPKVVFLFPVHCTSLTVDELTATYSVCRAENTVTDHTADGSGLCRAKLQLHYFDLLQDQLVVQPTDNNSK